MFGAYGYLKVPDRFSLENVYLLKLLWSEKCCISRCKCLKDEKDPFTFIAVFQISLFCEATTWLWNKKSETQLKIVRK